MKKLIRKFEDYSKKNNLSVIDFSIFIVAVLILFIGLIILIIFLFLLSKEYTILGLNPILVDKTGQVGDFIGGIVGTIWSLASFLLFYLALKFQSKEIQNQKEELNLQRLELKSHRIESTIARICNIIYKQSEIIDNKCSALKFELPRRYVNKKGFDAIDAFWIWELECFKQGKNVEDYIDKENDEALIFESFLSNMPTQEHFNTLCNSVDLCVSLIETTELDVTSKFNQCVLDQSTKNQLYSLLLKNVNSDKLIFYLNAIINVRKRAIKRYKMYGNNEGIGIDHENGQIARAEKLKNKIITIEKKSNRS